MVKNLPSNAEDSSSIPGLGTKIPHASGKLSPCAATTEPAALEPESHNQREAHAPHAPQQRAHPPQWRPHTLQLRTEAAKNKQFKKKDKKQGLEGQLFPMTSKRLFPGPTYPTPGSSRSPRSLGPSNRPSQKERHHDSASSTLQPGPELGDPSAWSLGTRGFTVQEGWKRRCYLPQELQVKQSVWYRLPIAWHACLAP